MTGTFRANSGMTLRLSDGVATIDERLVTEERIAEVETQLDQERKSPTPIPVHLEFLALWVNSARQGIRVAQGLDGSSMQKFMELTED